MHQSRRPSAAGFTITGSQIPAFEIQPRHMPLRTSCNGRSSPRDCDSNPPCFEEQPAPCFPGDVNQVVHPGALGEEAKSPFRRDAKREMGNTLRRTIWCRMPLLYPRLRGSSETSEPAQCTLQVRSAWRTRTSSRSPWLGWSLQTLRGFRLDRAYRQGDLENGGRFLRPS